MLQKTQEVLELIANDELFENNDIRFVGGTALRLTNSLYHLVVYHKLLVSTTIPTKIYNRLIHSISFTSFFY